MRKSANFHPPLHSQNMGTPWQQSVYMCWAALPGAELSVRCGCRGAGTCWGDSFPAHSHSLFSQLSPCLPSHFSNMNVTHNIWSCHQTSNIIISLTVIMWCIYFLLNNERIVMGTMEYTFKEQIFFMQVTMTKVSDLHSSSMYCALRRVKTPVPGDQLLPCCRLSV